MQLFFPLLALVGVALYIFFIATAEKILDMLSPDPVRQTLLEGRAEAQTIVEEFLKNVSTKAKIGRHLTPHIIEELKLLKTDLSPGASAIMDCPFFKVEGTAHTLTAYEESERGTPRDLTRRGLFSLTCVRTNAQGQRFKQTFMISLVDEDTFIEFTQCCIEAFMKQELPTA